MLITILFWVFAGVAIVSAIMTITRRSPVASALWLIQSFFALAAIYTLMQAYFIGIIQILVYAGAIMVLFLFVIMLLNLGDDYQADMRSNVWKAVAGGTGLILIALLARAVVGEQAPLGGVVNSVFLPTQTVERDAVGVIGIPMYSDFIVHLQVTGILLLIAVVGAVVLAKRRI